MIESKAWHEGVRLFEAGQYYDCHEVLEHEWLHMEGVHKHFLGGVILLAAALHKHRRQNKPRAARRLFARAMIHLAWVPDLFHHVYVRELEHRCLQALRDPSFHPKMPFAPARD